MNGPIVTNIRALLTPMPMQELRVKGEYQHHQKIKGSMGIKISAPGMELALPGSELFLCKND
jgi:translation initiation factor 5B